MAKGKELDINLFDIKFKKIPPKAGRMLIAQPSLNDSFFKRTVIYLVEHDAKGCMGFIVNRKLNISLSDILVDFPNVDVNVSVGGPVSPESINFLHTFGDLIPNTYPLSNGIYMNGDINALKALAIAGKVNAKNLRIFIGYSGWGPKQLENEIKENSWVVANFSPIDMMKGVYDSWYFAVQQLGEKFKVWTIYPENPSLN
ncbi:MAG TPA: YqgE/AlgH family protein [Bacteroidales bacterium]|nr:YqgE/AlgH family protein [Bacteroidales bacterium]